MPVMDNRDFLINHISALKLLGTGAQQGQLGELLALDEDGSKR